MKHTRRLSAIITVLVLVCGTYGWRAVSAATASVVPTVTSLATAPPQSSPMPWPIHGQAAVGAVGYGVLDQHNADIALPTASTAKIMTALCILQKHPLKLGESGPIITITQQDQAIYDTYYRQDGSLAAIRVGEKITEYQALEAMLLPSANNFADTLAIWAFGSLQAYDNYANQYATQLGLTNSHFAVDASGFDPATVSTAHDLTMLGIVAMQNPVLAQIANKPSAVIPVAGKIYNVNFLLGEHGIIGLKTGNNDQDKGAFLLAAKYAVTPTQSVTIVEAVMGGQSLIQAMQVADAMLLTAQKNFRVTTYVHAGEQVGQYKVPWSSASVDAVVAKDLSVTSWVSQPITPKVSLQKITAPAVAGQAVGTVSISLPDGSTTLTSPVTLKSAIGPPSLAWRLTHP